MRNFLHKDDFKPLILRQYHNIFLHISHQDTLGSRSLHPLSTAIDPLPCQSSFPMSYPASCSIPSLGEKPIQFVACKQHLHLRLARMMLEGNELFSKHGHNTPWQVYGYYVYHCPIFFQEGDIT